MASTAVALAVTLPEAAVEGLPETGHGALDERCTPRLAAACAGATAVVLGPGLLDREATRPLLQAVLPQLDDSVVLLDGVALTALAGAPELLDGLAGRVVLTPNAGETAALLDGEPREDEQAALDVAQRYGAVVALRGWVAAPDGSTWRDDAGGVGLGTSGSGDVLAGLVGGLLARGCPPAQAAVWGQYVHASAGDRLAARRGRLGFLARELLDEVPPVLAGLRS